MTALGMGHLSQKGPCPEHLALFQCSPGLSALGHWNGTVLGKSVRIQEESVGPNQTTPPLDINPLPSNSVGIKYHVLENRMG